MPVGVSYPRKDIVARVSEDSDQLDDISTCACVRLSQVKYMNERAGQYPAVDGLVNHSEVVNFGLVSDVMTRFSIIKTIIRFSWLS